MMAVGAIVVGLCGLCTYRVSTGGGGYGLEYIVGGIPILAGAFVIVKGYRRLAINRQPPSPKPHDEDD